MTFIKGTVYKVVSPNYSDYNCVYVVIKNIDDIGLVVCGWHVGYNKPHFRRIEFDALIHNKHRNDIKILFD